MHYVLADGRWAMVQVGSETFGRLDVWTRLVEVLDSHKGGLALRRASYNTTNSTL